MLQQKTIYIEPNGQTNYLVGPEGLVWVTPTLGGESFIMAARSETEREKATRFIGELLNMGLVPYGLPLNQRVNVAMFGGGPLRDCQWIFWEDAPYPAGDPGDDLPSRAAVID
jgi:hypothetical protein